MSSASTGLYWPDPQHCSAILNSLQMGFGTLAIQRRSSEVWQLLGATKTEFGKYADVLSKVKKKLDEASNTIDKAAVRTRAIERTLRAVEVPNNGAETLLVADDEPSRPRAGRPHRPRGLSGCLATQ